jgi:hypothetical protein
MCSTHNAAAYLSATRCFILFKQHCSALQAPAWLPDYAHRFSRAFKSMKIGLEMVRRDLSFAGLFSSHAARDNFFR